MNFITFFRTSYDFHSFFHTCFFSCAQTFTFSTLTISIFFSSQNSFFSFSQICRFSVCHSWTLSEHKNHINSIQFNSLVQYYIENSTLQLNYDYGYKWHLNECLSKRIDHFIRFGTCFHIPQMLVRLFVFCLALD